MNESLDRPRDFIVQATPMRDHPEDMLVVPDEKGPVHPGRSRRNMPALQALRTDVCATNETETALKHMYREFVSRMEFSPPLSTAATPESYTGSGETPSDTYFQTPTETTSVGTQTELDYPGEGLANLASDGRRSTTDGDGSSPGPTRTELSAPFQLTRPVSLSDNLEHSISAACRMLSRMEAMTQSLQGIMVRLVRDHRRLVDNSPRYDEISTKRTIPEDEDWNQEEVVTILDAWDEIGELNIA
ncbi:hypothetical protein B0T11DRAFT_302827 [Plectosphaerella cucumerina]|uniref:Uncharacterized protein n=1 Tax=Plectosphaerella cucumerina TaxID=40658 RepID=A0A8K0WY08_9PEZI|nr:hypothetical protein B0T11DRAFT_302827 [Plectosphaerella cucumerina]